jgi:anti-sigma B factor antagonist
VTFTTRKQGDTIVVGADGPVVVANRQELKQRVLDELERGERKFVIDFSQTGYIDSSGLGVLVTLSRTIREQGGDLRLANLNDDLRRLFELTKLDSLFHLSGGGDGAADAGVHAPVRPAPRAGGARKSPPRDEEGL